MTLAGEDGGDLEPDSGWVSLSEVFAGGQVWSTWRFRAGGKGLRDRLSNASRASPETAVALKGRSEPWVAGEGGSVSNWLRGQGRAGQRACWVWLLAGSW